MQNNRNIVRAGENSNVLAISTYFKRVRREKIVTRIQSTAKPRKFEIKLTDELINKAIRNDTLKE